MAEIGIEKIGGILLILIVVVILIFAFSGKLYAAIKPILGMNASIEIEQERNKNNAIEEVYSLFTRCKDSVKTNCTCAGNSLINLEDAEMEIEQRAENIWIVMTDSNDKFMTRSLKGEYCYFLYDRTDKQFRRDALILESSNGRIVSKYNGKGIFNPMQMYKLNKDGKHYLCIESEEYSKGEREKRNDPSCF